MADGGTPWCFGFESGYADGWPGTDFIESLVLRAGGVDVYDAWTTGEIGFTSPEVMEAGRLADDLIFEPGFVRGGPATISEQWFYEPIDPPARARRSDRRDRTGVLAVPPGSSLHVWQFAPPDSELGSDIDFFLLPPIDPSQPTPAIGRRPFASAWSTRPRFGRSWSSSPVRSGVRSGPPILTAASSPPTGDSMSRPTATPTSIRTIAFNTRCLRGPDRAGSRGVQVRRLRSDARRDRRWTTTASSAGAFWQGMLDWVDGIRSIDQVFADIDAEWAALRAEGETPPPDS